MKFYKKLLGSFSVRLTWSEDVADMDKVDRSILEILQLNGRLTNAEIAARVCLSAPACWKRLKRLEEEVIIGYHAHLNQQAVGLGLFAFISVTLDNHSKEAMENFELGVLGQPNIVACHKISGQYDYLLQVVVKDMTAFHDLAMHRIRELGNVKEMYTGFSIKEIKRSTTLPL